MKVVSSNERIPKSQALMLSIVRDGDNHLDDVDMNLNYLVFRITPSSLQDCSEALTRVLELIDIMTRAMERRVHAAGHLARTAENKGKSTTLSCDSQLLQHS